MESSLASHLAPLGPLQNDDLAPDTALTDFSLNHTVLGLITCIESVFER